ncbi:MAG: hypothetical protein ACI8V2_001862 [Candidatus Latescibacterota bacterium]|jgi:hypothetical protein
MITYRIRCGLHHIRLLSRCAAINGLKKQVDTKSLQNVETDVKKRHCLWLYTRVDALFDEIIDFF